MNCIPTVGILGFGLDLLGMFIQQALLETLEQLVLKEILVQRVHKEILVQLERFLRIM
jgi:hypothetical protein